MTFRHQQHHIFSRLRVLAEPRHEPFEGDGRHLVVEPPVPDEKGRVLRVPIGKGLVPADHRGGGVPAGFGEQRPANCLHDGHRMVHKHSLHHVEAAHRPGEVHHRGEANARGERVRVRRVVGSHGYQAGDVGAGGKAREHQPVQVHGVRAGVGRQKVQGPREVFRGRGNAALEPVVEVDHGDPLGQVGLDVALFAGFVAQVIPPTVQKHESVAGTPGQGRPPRQVEVQGVRRVGPVGHVLRDGVGGQGLRRGLGSRRRPLHGTAGQSQQRAESEPIERETHKQAGLKRGDTRPVRRYEAGKSQRPTQRGQK